MKGMTSRSTFYFLEDSPSKPKSKTLAFQGFRAVEEFYLSKDPKFFSSFVKLLLFKQLSLSNYTRAEDEKSRLKDFSSDN